MVVAAFFGQVGLVCPSLRREGYIPPFVPSFPYTRTRIFYTTEVLGHPYFLYMFLRLITSQIPSYPPRSHPPAPPPPTSSQHPFPNAHLSADLFSRFPEGPPFSYPDPRRSHL